jgi:hypothetical protein
MLGVVVAADQRLLDERLIGSEVMNRPDSESAEGHAGDGSQHRAAGNGPPKIPRCTFQMSQSHENGIGTWPGEVESKFARSTGLQWLNHPRTAAVTCQRGGPIHRGAQ